ncbi:MAG: DUF123 domain-containing protein [Vulcanisaeta sp. AZ3]|jgi:Uri superfamily endonuclease|nr:MAG: hypothetical protein TU36_05100 [Vulcanisaeta sp. AZ3]
MVKALSYVTLFKCSEGYIRTRGSIFIIKDGIYAYVGSCGNYCGARIMRHLNKVSNRFWHVDYLHEICNELGAVVLPYKEEDIARALLSRFMGVPNFGCSDKKQDKTHLFRIGNSDNESTIALIREMLRVIHGVLDREKAY